MERGQGRGSEEGVKALALWPGKQQCSRRALPGGWNRRVVQQTGAPQLWGHRVSTLSTSRARMRTSGWQSPLSGVTQASQAKGDRGKAT